MIDGCELRKIAQFAGVQMYMAADLDPLRPPRSGAVGVAVGLLGGGAITFLANAKRDAELAVANGIASIFAHPRIHARRLNFAVGRELGRWWMRDYAWYRDLPPIDRDAVANALGAWLVAPEPAMLELRSRGAIDIGAVANAFAISWTCAQMRDSETGGPDSVIVTPTKVYGRGSGILARLPESDARALAAAPAPKSVRKIVFRDDPSRVALLLRSA